MIHPPSPKPLSTRWSRQVVVAGLVIVAAVALTYANSLRGPFVYDDIPAIVENTTLREGWRLDRVLLPPPGTTASGRPVLNLSLAINMAVSGTEVWSYHALNVAIHALAALTLFGLVRRTLVLIGSNGHRKASTFGPDAGDDRVMLIACSVALLWGLHPLATEAVDYVVQRAESLMGLFLLLTLYCFVRGATADPVNGRPGRPGWFAASVVFCLLGMATKENMAAAPLLVLLYDRAFLAGTFREAWHRHARLYSGLIATWVVLAALVLSTGGNRGGSVGIGVGVSAWGYWLTQPAALLRYAVLSAWPFPLVFDYGSFSPGRPDDVLLPAISVIVCVAGVIWLLARNRPAGFAGAAGLAILAPTSVMPGTTQMIVEHRMYLSLAAVLAVAVTCLHMIIGRRSLVAVLVAALALAGLTVARNAVYRDDLLLWSDTAAKRPRNAQAFFHLGHGCQTRGRLEDAVAFYRKAVDIYPGYVEAQNNLGNTLCQLGRYAEALPHYEQVLKTKPADPVTHNNAGNALNVIGRPADAIGHYERALQQNPSYVEARINLGATLTRLGRSDEALVQYERALMLEPRSGKAHAGLADALVKSGRPGEAWRHYETALREDPRNAELHAVYASALADNGRMSDALVQFEQAVTLRPDAVELRYNYAVTLLGAGRDADAVAQLEAIVHVRPDFMPARDALNQLRSADLARGRR